MKIAINARYGGFQLSDHALFLLNEMGLKYENYSSFLIKRNDPRLISIIEKLGEEAWGPGAEIKIVEIPDDVKDWYITDYDGIETIGEGRTW